MFLNRTHFLCFPESSHFRVRTPLRFALHMWTQETGVCSSQIPFCPGGFKEAAFTRITSASGHRGLPPFKEMPISEGCHSALIHPCKATSTSITMRLSSLPAAQQVTTSMTNGQSPRLEDMRRLLQSCSHLRCRQ